MESLSPIYNSSFQLNLFYVVSLFSSAGLFLYLRSRWKEYVPEFFFWIHFAIVSWSALMYLNLLFETGLHSYVWYMDWIVSTPLIMLALGLTAMYPLKKINYSLLFATMFTQLMIIITGLFAQMSYTRTGMNAFFVIGNAYMILIFYLIFGPLMECAHENKALHTKFKNLASLLVMFWISYPVAWMIGTPGMKIISPFATNVLFVFLPLLCKPVFGIIDLLLLKSMIHQK